MSTNSMKSVVHAAFQHQRPANLKAMPVQQLLRSEILFLAARLLAIITVSTLRQTVLPLFHSNKDVCLYNPLARDHWRGDTFVYEELARV